MSDAIDINLFLKDLKRESDRAGVWNFYKQRIEMGFVLHQVPANLREVGIKENDTIITAISYRYKEDNYKELLSSCFGNNEFFKLGNTILAISTNV